MYLYISKACSFVVYGATGYNNSVAHFAKEACTVTVLSYIVTVLSLVFVYLCLLAQLALQGLQVELGFKI